MKIHTDADLVMLLQMLSVMKKLELIDREIYDSCRLVILIERGLRGR